MESSPAIVCGEDTLEGRFVRVAGAGFRGTSSLVRGLVDVFEDVEGRRGEFTLGLISWSGRDGASNLPFGGSSSSSLWYKKERRVLGLGIVDNSVLDMGIGSADGASSSVRGL